MSVGTAQVEEMAEDDESGRHCKGLA